jgi:hypothetical protein
MADPAEKYRDKVDPSHKMAMDAIGMIRQVLSPHREVMERLLDSERQMHNFGHVLNPTLYNDMIYSKSFEQQTRLIKAALAFLDEADAVAAELETVDQ